MRTEKSFHRMIHAKLGRVLLAALLMLLTLLPGRALAEEGTGGSIPRVTFTNGTNKTPDLYVEKEVTGGSGYTVSDVSFEFTLKLNGKPASGVTYRLFDRNGTELYNTAADGNEIPFTTSRSGDFYLKDGQKAKFEYVGLGKTYEISEASAEGFTQIQPAGGASAVGTVTAEGAYEKFRNRYVPSTPPTPDPGDPTPPGTPDTTTLTIAKHIAFPAGYSLPEDTPEFGFTLRIDGSVYANRSYILVDNVYGEEKEDAGDLSTDSEGHFTIPGGYTAVFTEVPTDVDYLVREDSEDDWWTVGGGYVRAGATVRPSTDVNYTNGSASFAVTKRLSSGTSEDAFTFTLLNDAKSAWADAPYYLYTVYGEPVRDEANAQVKGVTDEKGRFTLQAGQAAVFTGIRPGTSYQVKEQASSAYTQLVPASTEGYEKKVQRSVEVLPFVNEPVPDSMALTVTKVVENASKDAPEKAEEFAFILTKKQSDGSYEPVSKEVYSIRTGENQQTYRTDEDGKFYLTADQTARFERLTPKGEYRVEELQTAEDYFIQDEDLRFQEGILENSLAFTFTNVYVNKLTDLVFLKVDEKGEALAGAKFALYADEDLTELLLETVTEEDGLITVSDIAEGTYYLQETEAPEGYQVLEKAVKVTIAWGSEIRVEAEIADQTYTRESDVVTVETEQSNGRGRTRVTVKVANEPETPEPEPEDPEPEDPEPETPAPETPEEPETPAPTQPETPAPTQPETPAPTQPETPAVTEKPEKETKTTEKTATTEKQTEKQTEKESETSETVKTGDSTPLRGLTMLLLVSGFVLITASYRRISSKKRR